MNEIIIFLNICFSNSTRNRHGEGVDVDSTSRSRPEDWRKKKGLQSSGPELGF